MWAPVDAADALELLSPAFVSDEVGGLQAVKLTVVHGHCTWRDM